MQATQHASVAKASGASYDYERGTARTWLGKCADVRGIAGL
jgi:hypothetical protein